MQLEGSCHCGAVSFSLTSAHPYPYQRCYCSICRKTQGGGGYAINLGAMPPASRYAVASTSRFIMRDSRTKAINAPTAARRAAFLFGLWLGLVAVQPEWPELIHPFASAIDTAAAGTAGTHALDARFESAVGGGQAHPGDQQFEPVPKNPSPSGMSVSARSLRIILIFFAHGSSPLRFSFG